MVYRSVKTAPDTTAAPRRVFVLALALSVFAHAGLYIAMPRFVDEFTPVHTVRFDASLTPIQKSAVGSSRSQATSRQKPRTMSKPVLPAAVASKSEVNFAAPENAIAVDAIGPAGDAPPMGELSPAPAPIENLSAAQAEVPLPGPVQAVLSTPTRVLPVFAERISIEYKLSTAVADGVANFKWTRKGNEYEIDSSTQATGFFISVFAGVIHQQSRGAITDEGLRPTNFSIRRGEGEAEIAEFARTTNSLTFKRHNDVRTVPLSREMQDMQSFLFQLAYDAPRLEETGGKLDVLVTNARKVYRYQFKKIGEATVETRFGQIDTIHLLSEAANPEDAYEVWLAPSYFYLPVKLKMYMGRFPIEQIATRIGISGAAGPADSDVNAGK